MPWVPPPRSPWADKLVALGHDLGDGGRSVISLRPEDLTAAAVATTGLDDFGDAWWEEPFRRLCASLDSEARLHLPGRLRTRGELQVILQNRLRMVDLWNREPAVLRQPVTAPIVVTGLGRSGTTLLHELLACDPANRPPLLWELLHTVPYDDASGDLCDDEIRLMDEIIPAFTAMHENGGRLPTECIFAFAHQFSSDIYTGLYNVADYTVWRSGRDQAPIYEWHKRHLQTLQWVTERPTTRWVVKAPSHLSALPLVFTTYPDARVVVTHRDPLRVIGSLSDLMATLHSMHSEHVDHGVLVEFMAMGLEMQMDHVTAERDAGAIPGDQIADVVYRDLVADPVARDRTPLHRVGAPGHARVPLGARGLPGRPPHGPCRRARLLLRRHRPRPGHAPRPGGAVPEALRRPVRGLIGVASEHHEGEPRGGNMDWKLETIVVPVADVDRAKAFYADAVGFHVDVDHSAGEDFRVVQLTPPGSGCSISLMKNEGAAGTLQGLQVVVRDVDAARRQLVDGGVAATEVFHFADGVQVDGPDPGRVDYGTFLSFSDPDGNGWLLQEVPSRPS